MERNTLKAELEKIFKPSFFPATKKEAFKFVDTGEPIPYEVYMYIQKDMKAADHWMGYNNVEEMLPPLPIEYPVYIQHGSSTYMFKSEEEYIELKSRGYYTHGYNKQVVDIFAPHFRKSSSLITREDFMEIFNAVQQYQRSIVGF